MTNTTRRNLLLGRIHAPAENTVVRLPWSISENRFIDQCTRCEDCLSACPENIITNGEGKYPVLNFRLGGCTFCQDCVTACKQPLFNTTEYPWQNQAEINENCLTKQGVFCQNCKDACDAKAITFHYGTNRIPIPIIQPEQCNGCGACVSPCPNNSIQIQTSVQQEKSHEL